MSWNSMRRGGLPFPADEIDDRAWINSPMINAPASPIEGPPDVNGAEREVLGYYLDYIQSKSGDHPLRTFTYNVLSNNGFDNKEFGETYERALMFSGALIASGECRTVREAAKIAVPKVIDIFAVWLASKFEELQDPAMEDVALSLIEDDKEIRAFVKDYVQSIGRSRGRRSLGSSRGAWGNDNRTERRTEDGSAWGSQRSARRTTRSNASSLGDGMFKSQGRKVSKVSQDMDSDDPEAIALSMAAGEGRRRVAVENEDVQTPSSSVSPFDMAKETRLDRYDNEVVVEGNPDYPISRDWTEEQPLAFLYDPRQSVLTYMRRAKDSKIVEIVLRRKGEYERMATVAQHSLAIASADYDNTAPSKTSGTDAVHRLIEPAIESQQLDINVIEGNHFISAAATNGALRSALLVGNNIEDTAKEELYIYSAKKVYVIPSKVSIYELLAGFQTDYSSGLLSLKTGMELFMQMNPNSAEAVKSLDAIFTGLVNETLTRDFVHKARLKSFIGGVSDMCEALLHRYSKPHLQHVEDTIMAKIRGYLRLVPKEEAFENYKGLMVLPDKIDTTIIERVTNVLVVPFTADALNLYGESSTGMISEESSTLLYEILKGAFDDVTTAKQLVTSDNVTLDVEKSTVNSNCWRITML